MVKSFPYDWLEGSDLCSFLIKAYSSSFWKKCAHLPAIKTKNSLLRELLKCFT